MAASAGASNGNARISVENACAGEVVALCAQPELTKAMHKAVETSKAGLALTLLFFGVKNTTARTQDHNNRTLSAL